MRCVLGHRSAYGAPPLPWVAATARLQLRRALHRCLVDFVCVRCLSDRAVEEARQANREARRAAQRILRDRGGLDR
jgi:hypothetical protein